MVTHIFSGGWPNVIPKKIVADQNFVQKKIVADQNFIQKKNVADQNVIQKNMFKLHFGVQNVYAKTDPKIHPNFIQKFYNWFSCYRNVWMDQKKFWMNFGRGFGYMFLMTKTSFKYEP